MLKGKGRGKGILRNLSNWRVVLGRLPGTNRKDHTQQQMAVKKQALAVK